MAAQSRPKHRDYMRAWRAANPEKAKQQALESARRSRIKNRPRRPHLPEPTRPVPEHCECCGRAESGLVRRLALDHCHTTGKFRGWLCGECNLGIGKLGDNLVGVLNAVKYLERNG